MQLPLDMFVPKSDWQPPNLSELPSWAGVKRVGIDTETKDPDIKALGPGVRRKGSHVTGVSFAFEDGPSFYLPMRHEGGGNLDPDQVKRYLDDNMRFYDGIAVFANASYDLDWLAEEGLSLSKVKFIRDVQVAEPLICELYDSYSLEAIAGRHGFDGKDEHLLREAAAAYGINAKSDMWRLHSKYVGPYAGRDAALPLQILRKQERIIDEQDIWETYDLESRLTPCLVGMRRRGIRVNLDKLEQIERWSTAQETEALAEVYAQCGVRIAVGDVWKAECYARALEAIGVAVKYTQRGKKRVPSVDKNLLASVDHPVARALEKARKVNKLRTTFAQSVRDHLTNGRIHTTLNQLRKQKDEEVDDDVAGAAYGRLSCEHPNMQQQPARDEFAKMWRDIYEPEDGCLWFSNDYSQQEPRVLVDLGTRCRGIISNRAYLAACEAAKKYTDDPTTDNHQMMADMAGIKRKAAKEIFLGLCYGMGGAKLCRKLGLPTAWWVRGPRGVLYLADSPEGKRLVDSGERKFEGAGLEGQKLLDTFDEKVPFVRELSKAISKAAAAKGYITTLGGRRCRFPQDEAGNYDWTHKGLNRYIQGSSADQTKRAVVAVYEAGYWLQLQVHDELNGSVSSEREAHEIAEIQRNCLPLNLPSKVDVELGSSWGDSMS